MNERFVVGMKVRNTLSGKVGTVEAVWPNTLTVRMADGTEASDQRWWTTEEGS